MNERTHEMWRECVLKHTRDPMNWQTVADEFAELIIEQCCVALNPMLRDMISRGQGQELIRQHFGVEERKGWFCPKCGVDRTKTKCPLGFGASVDGRCPMIATAQTGVEL